MYHCEGKECVEFIYIPEGETYPHDAMYNKPIHISSLYYEKETEYEIYVFLMSILHKTNQIELRFPSIFKADGNYRGDGVARHEHTETCYKEFNILTKDKCFYMEKLPYMHKYSFYSFLTPIIPFGERLKIECLVSEDWFCMNTFYFSLPKKCVMDYYFMLGIFKEQNVVFEFYYRQNDVDFKNGIFVDLKSSKGNFHTTALITRYQIYGCINLIKGYTHTPASLLSKCYHCLWFNKITPTPTQSEERLFTDYNRIMTVLHSINISKSADWYKTSSVFNGTTPFHPSPDKHYYESYFENSLVQVALQKTSF